MIQGLRHAFPRNLFFSQSVRKIYKYAAIGSILFLFAYIGIAVLFLLRALSSTGVATSLLKCVMLAGALCVGAVNISMQYYCFRFDRSSPWVRTSWFVFMIISVLPIVSLLYFYLVYLPQTRPSQPQALSASNAS